MENIVYEEWVPTGKLVKGLFMMVTIIIIVITAVILVLTKTTFEDRVGLIIAWSTLAFLLIIYWNFRGIKIQINQKTLIVKYGAINKKTFKLQDIISCKTTKSSFKKYLGMGVRYGTDGSTAYTTSLGDAVKITTKTGEKFVFSSKNPHLICEKIQEIT